MDLVTGGRIFLNPNVQVDRGVGGTVQRYGGTVLAGVEGLAFKVQDMNFLALALRTATGAPAGTWGYATPMPTFTFQGGAVDANSTADEAAKLWGCVVNELRLTQEYPRDGAPLMAEMQILALGGEAPVAVAAKTTALAKVVMKSHMSLVTLGGIDIPSGVAPAGGMRLRKWEITVRNNQERQNYGDKQATTDTTTGRGVGASGDLREAFDYLNGEEHIECSIDVEVPVDSSTAADFTANGYTPGAFTLSAAYTNGISSTAATIALVNMCFGEDQGWEFRYLAEGLDREPVKVFTNRFVKNNPLLQSLSFANS
jgi:hypothetical protein